MALATRDEFFAVTPKFKDVDVPELGEGKRIRVVEIGSKDKLRYIVFAKRDGDEADANFDNARLKGIVLSCRNAEGQPLFTDADIPALEAYPAEVIERLAFAVDELSGLYTQATEIRQLFNQAQTSASPSL